MLKTTLINYRNREEKEKRIHYSIYNNAKSDLLKAGTPQLKHHD